MIRTVWQSLFTVRHYSQKVAQPLRSRKPKSEGRKAKDFVDFKKVRAYGGNGGNGCISFLQLWCNENAGPDGGDGGNGGHVIFKADANVKDLNHVASVLKADSGEKGSNKDCNGKNAEHLIVDVPLGTIIKSKTGQVVGDLFKDGLMFVAARGGAGGKGNHFFISDTVQAPKICECGAEGENLEYSIEIRSMAHIGLIGFPNAGKSTLLNAVSRAKPKIAPYPFTTLKPHLGIIQYDDYEQVTVADLPGLIADSHKNRGLGIQFLQHIERCSALLYVLDMSLKEPWEQLNVLQYELSQFNENFVNRPQIIVANKMDLPASVENLKHLKQHTSLIIIPVSAKIGTNLTDLLLEIKLLYDKSLDMLETSNSNNNGED